MLFDWKTGALVSVYLSVEIQHSFFFLLDGVWFFGHQFGFKSMTFKGNHWAGFLCLSGLSPAAILKALSMAEMLLMPDICTLWALFFDFFKARQIMCVSLYLIN